MRARVRIAQRGMNRTEAAYALWLEAQRRADRLQWYAFEPLRIVLAANTQYTPDFVLLTREGEIEAHEVKGFWRDDARVKLKVAARALPWIRFVAVQKSREGWNVEEIKP